jgi:hypothetical protein
MSSASYMVTRCTRRKSDGEVCKIRYIVVYDEAMIMPTKIRNLGHALSLSLPPCPNHDSSYMRILAHHSPQHVKLKLLAPAMRFSSQTCTAH